MTSHLFCSGPFICGRISFRPMAFQAEYFYSCSATSFAMESSSSALILSSNVNRQ